MTCDEDTIANFTNHAYFNLAGQGSGSALDQKVWIDADQFTLSDQYCVTTGELALVKDTPMDFTQFKAIGRDIEADYEQLKLAGGYDHNWVLNHKTGELSLSAKAMDEASRTRAGGLHRPSRCSVLHRKLFNPYGRKEPRCL